MLLYFLVELFLWRVRATGSTYTEGLICRGSVVGIVRAVRVVAVGIGGVTTGLPLYLRSKATCAARARPFERLHRAWGGQWQVSCC